jgi:hypothetical protein
MSRSIGTTGQALKSAPALILLLVALPIYLLRADRVVGMMGDDAWYVLLAKALAEGQGYQLINSPLAGIFPGYPPGFPALLSLVFQVRPDFPGNVWLLKSVSIVAMLCVGLLTDVYFRRRDLPPHLAAAAAAAVIITPALVFLATSTLMSEAVFTFAQLATVAAADRAVAASEEDRWHSLLFAGVLAAATVLVRSAGIAGVAGVLLFLIKQRLWRRAAVFAAVVAMCLASWFIYAGGKTPTPAQREVHRGSVVYSYADQFLMRWAGSPSSGQVTLSELPARVGRNIVDVSGRAMGGIFGPVLLRGPEESGEEVLSLGASIGWTFVGMGTPANLAISFVLSGIVFWGFVRSVREKVTVAEFIVPISLVLTLIWPFHTFRFVLPLAPFLYFYLIQGLRIPTGFSAARIAILTIAALHLYDHAGYVTTVRSSPASVDWIARFDEVDSTLSWMRAHLDREAIVATTNPALTHLYTGHKTITLDTLAEKWSVWHKRGARYVASLVRQPLPGEWRGSYKLVYDAAPAAPATERVWVIEIE